MTEPLVKIWSFFPGTIHDLRELYLFIPTDITRLCPAMFKIAEIAGGVQRNHVQ